MKRSLTKIFLALAIVIKLGSLSSCANIIPPSGGLRDSLPPVLAASIPKDSATNVTGKNIVLTFDEYVTLQNTQNIIISPNPVLNATITSLLKNVTIRLKDTLEPNTTYSINFGDAIKDVNEGNIARGFTYVFSTGNKIDNNSYTGKVLLAEKGKPDSTLIVILHRSLEDSAVAKLSPRYYTRINGKGEFAFRHLPAGVFSVYVVTGDAYLKRYSDSTRLFAFKNTPVTINANTPRDTLYAFEAFKKTTASTTTLPATPVTRGAAKEDKRLRYTSGLESGLQDLLSPLTFTFNRKLASFDSSRFVLYDTNYHRLGNFSATLDTSATKISLRYPWKENQSLRLIISKDAVADSAGTTLTKNDTVRLATRKESDYGSIRIRFGNLTLSKNPVLQIVLNDKLVESVPLTTAEFQRKLFKPGAYELRILYDRNKNGIWDTGNFKLKKQPESVYLIPQQIAIRANWDNEVRLSLQ